MTEGQRQNWNRVFQHSTLCLCGVLLDYPSPLIPAVAVHGSLGSRSHGPLCQNKASD